MLSETHLTVDMNFFKRAMISILRRPVKTLILLLLVLILGTVITGAISVEGAINNTDANLRRQMRPIVSIDLDWRGTADISFFDLPILTPTDVRAIGELSYVDFYEYMILSSLYSFELKNYTGDQMRSWTPGTPDFFDLRGTSRFDFIQIEQEMIELVAGRTFAENELIPGEYQSVALISEAFANENNLSIGSIFELYSFVFFPREDEELMFWRAELFADENIYARVGVEFEVIGLYDVPIDSERDTIGNRRNRDRIDDLGIIYVPNWAIEDVTRRQNIAEEAAWDAVDFENPFGNYRMPSETRVTPVFVLGDPAYLDNFKNAAEPLLPEFHFFNDLSSAFDEIATSMVNLQNIADWVLYVAIGATLLILGLVITLFLYDRRHEIGIYLAIGEGKRNIITQILLEIVITSFVGITLAIFVGHFITDTMAQILLRNELVAQSEEREGEFVFEGEWTVLDRIGIPTQRMTPDEMMEAFDVSLGIRAIGLFYTVGLGTVVLSTLIPIFYIVRLKPKKVLL